MKAFVDKHTLTLLSGKGGQGAVSFRREKFVPKGGPDGGDGGNGGAVFLRASERLVSLAHLRPHKTLKAGNGDPGKAMNKHGKNGVDLVVEVPLGTWLSDLRGRSIADLRQPNKPFLLLKGGKGGKGNSHFASSTNQSPRHSGPGDEGLRATIHLDIKRIADIGLVGFPNAGKSTFLNTITRAKSRAAPYAFTTTKATLGLYELDLEKSLVVADLPGIIDGAHKGKGLGMDFLNQMERTLFLLYVIDSTDENPHQSFLDLRKELSSYRRELADRPYAIALSKCELAQNKEAIAGLFPKQQQKHLFFLSSFAGLGLEDFKELAYRVYGSKHPKPATAYHVG